MQPLPRRSDRIGREFQRASHLLVLLCTITAAAAAGPLAGGSDIQQPNGLTAGGFIGVYADPNGTEPCGTIPTGSIGMLYVVATAPPEGFTGVAFRIEVTSPAGYQFFYTPPPAAAIVLGNPLDLTPEDFFDVTGANIAFSTCQTGPRVGMGTILVVNTSGGPTELQVKRRSPTADPGFQCPVLASAWRTSWSEASPLL